MSVHNTEDQHELSAACSIKLYFLFFLWFSINQLAKLEKNQLLIEIVEVTEVTLIIIINTSKGTQPSLGLLEKVLLEKKRFLKKGDGTRYAIKF